MAGPSRPVALARHAVGAALDDLEPPGAASLLVVACSGGADSLALAAATGFIAQRRHPRWLAAAVVIDHGLQAGSREVADRAAGQAAALGLDPVRVIAAQVDGSAGRGPEAAAREARYAALSRAAVELGARVVLTGHTIDDQAEQVLLGLARGSGARSLSGMPAARPLTDGVRLARPFLSALRRAHTEQVCHDLGLVPWHDPHNTDPSFTRTRARHGLGHLEEVLGPGVTTALARSAAQLREDDAALAAAAATAYQRLGQPPWLVPSLLALPRAVRTRLLQLGMRDAGSSDVAAVHLDAVDALLVDWHGQGDVALPGGVRARREKDRLMLTSPMDSSMGQAGPPPTH